MWGKVLFGLCAIAVAASTGFGLYVVWEQHRKNTTFVSVNATVEACWVEPFSYRHDGEIHFVYRPVVSYHYDVGGKSFASTFVRPNLWFAAVTESGSEEAAHRQIRAWQIGQGTTAYYDPANPSDAYLLPFYTDFPYLLLMLSLTWVPVWPPSHFHYRRPKLVANQHRLGWHVLTTDDPRRAFFVSAFALVTWIGILLGISVAWPELSGQRQIAMFAGLGGFFGILPVALMYETRRGFTVGSVTVRRFGDQYVLGDTVKLEIEAVIRRPARVEAIGARAFCMRIKGKPLWEKSVELPIDTLECQNNIYRAQTGIQLPETAPDDPPPKIVLGKRPPLPWRLHCGVRLCRRGLVGVSLPFKVQIDETEK